MEKRDDALDGIARAVDFIAQARWVWAKTYAEIAPHWYCVRKECRRRGIEEEFEAFIRFIRQRGYRARWGTSIHIYFELDGWKYWTMGWPVEQTTILNRAELALDPQQPLPGLERA